MKNIPLLLGTIIGTVVLIIVIATMSSGSTTTDQSQPVVDITQVVGDARHSYTAQSNQLLDTSQETSTNSAQAPENQELITIVEFSDFQCPACKASQPAVQRVLDTYPENVQLVFRHFPLDSIHPNARLAAIASEAVASLDKTKFWPFHDVLFVNQQIWSEIRSRDELKETFVGYAVDLGLNKEEFLEKMEDDSIAQLVNQDVSVATQLGVNATPTFYVNGVKTSAQQLLSTVESLLN